MVYEKDLEKQVLLRDKGLAWMDQIDRIGGVTYDTVVSRAELYQHSGDAAAALLQYDVALRMQPDDAYALEERGRLKLKTGDAPVS